MWFSPIFYSQKKTESPNHTYIQWWWKIEPYLAERDRERERNKFSQELNGIPLQYSCLENPTDGESWWAAVHGVAKSWTQLSDFTFTFHFHALEKEMATHSSILAWRVPGTGELGGLPSMGSHRVGHNWSDLAAAAANTDIRIIEFFYMNRSI